VYYIANHRRPEGGASWCNCPSLAFSKYFLKVVDIKNT